MKEIPSSAKIVNYTFYKHIW